MNSLLFSLLSISVASAGVIDPFKLVKVPTCTEEMSIGPCSDRDNSCKLSGYMCDTTTSLCCPMVDYKNEANIAGPALKGTDCEALYTPVNIIGSDSSPECVSLESLPAEMLCPEDRKTDTPAYCSPTSDTCAAGTTCFPVAGVCCKNVAPVVSGTMEDEADKTPSINHAIDKISNSRIVVCDESIAVGECTWDNHCEERGYMCDSENNLCCPVVDYINHPEAIKGPALNGKCEPYTVYVKIPGGEVGGECVSVQAIPGICPFTIGDVNQPVQNCDDNFNCNIGFTCFDAAQICCPQDFVPVYDD
ncbi:hypothetical protein PRIPAC_93490 [Pristionchus pacificus]|uniref:Uncharacterized protein n=1 Tax=Pristionchus pacificus TaxID=54126 RepID=A0A2A6BQL7_PRIPA|nr:hypothetical protein PRIPAC_93490 [Pristionchus pacificus]|eukprot:PDM68242.1 hypothetical protein PRIPAC_46286 [Pristionchus pacificus]